MLMQAYPYSLVALFNTFALFISNYFLFKCENVISSLTVKSLLLEALDRSIRLNSL